MPAAVLCGLTVAILAVILPFQNLPAAQQPAGTGRITGAIVAADTGAPVKRATVTLLSFPVPKPAEGRGAPVGGGRAGVISALNSPVTGQTTDDAGRFEFTDLAPGDYRLAVAPQSGFSRPERPQVVRLEEGKTASVTIRLDRTGAIVGRLLDESGEPLARARVAAVHARPRAGGLPMTAGSATTDDRGHFRIFDLAAGEYYVTGRHANLPGMYAQGQAQGYGTTFYPGATSLDRAQIVKVAAGQDSANIDFSLARVALARITGTLRDSTGAVPSRGPGLMLSVNLVNRQNNSMPEGRGVSPAADGTFVISGVEPGDYYVFATISQGTGVDARREAAYAPITIAGGDHAVNLTTNTGATVSGRVIVEGAPRFPPGVPPRRVHPQINIGVNSVPGDFPFTSLTMGRPARVAEDGTFELTGVRGKVLLKASGSVVLKSIVRDGVDLTTAPIELRGTERLSDVVVTMTWDYARVEGMVTNDRGLPAPGSWVVIFPDNPARWVVGHPVIQTTRALLTGISPPAGRSGYHRVAGSFMSLPVLPGRYRLAAIEGKGDETMAPTPDIALLEKLRKVAVSVDLTPGDPVVVQLRTIKPF